ncbi:hypothetical protein ACRAWG_11375 [Methylobacterium sp. P31]
MATPATPVVEHDALCALGRELQGLDVNGWRLAVPTCFHVSLAPPALVMSSVPGLSLSRWMESGHRLPDALFAAVPAAVLDALLVLWSRGKQHGDLQLHNIMCDVEGKVISFIDPDAESPVPSFGPLSRWHEVATGDLSYLLYDASVTVSGPAARRAPLRHQEFAKRVLTAAIGKIEGAESVRALVEAVDRGARQRVRTHVALSWSLGLPWKLVLRWLASRRITRIISSLDMPGSRVQQAL